MSGLFNCFIFLIKNLTKFRDYSYLLTACEKVEDNVYQQACRTLVNLGSRSGSCGIGLHSLRSHFY